MDIYFIPTFFALLILIGYGYIFFLQKRREKENLNWQNRLQGLLSPSQEKTEKALSLIKKEEPSDVYLKSKLRKIEGLRQWLQQAGLEMSPTVFIVICMALGIIIILFLYFYAHANFLISCIIGIFLSLIFPWALLSFLRNHHKNIFLKEFPMALDIIQRALRAGFSTDRALGMVAEQQKGPIGRVFQTIGDKILLGESPEAVLGDMANRIGLDEFRLLAIVFILQRETGGSLAEATENLANIIRARDALKQKVKALTAEVRVSAAILTSLPFLSVAGIYLSSPKYLDPLFTTEAGKYLLIVGGGLLVTGVSIIIRMSYKEVY